MDPTVGSSNMDRIEGSCCVVTVSRSAARQPASSCSGVILDHGTGTVLCSGFPFSPFVDLSGATDGSGRWFVLPDGFTARPDVRVHVHAPGAPPRHAEPLMLIRCREFSDAFRALFRDSDQWRFHNDDDDHDPEGSGSDGSGLLGWFAVLRADPDPRPCPVNRVPRAASASLRKGAAVVACGSPFGALCPDLFANALSAGIVSNLCGEDNAVILTDARCLPGTEGGGLFVMDDDDGGGDPRLVGVIVSSLCWKGAEWVGLTLVCSLHLIVRNIREVDVNSPLRELSCLHGDAPPQGLQLLNTASSSSASSASSSSSPGWREYPTVCLVDGGRVWGSGVVVAARLVLTCRHVVNGQKTVGLRFHQQQGRSDLWSEDVHWPGRPCVVYCLEYNNRMRCPLLLLFRSRVVVGDVLFSTKPSSSYDLAVVQLRDDAPEAVVPVVAKSFRPGEEVVVVGYGGLGKSCGPSLTGGILSKAVSWDGLPVMLQTTCAVQAGASGGAVVRKHSGELLGIVSSNTKDCAANVTYPHLNFSIPGTVFQPLLQRFNQTGDTEAFRDLDASDARVRRVWRLQNPPSKL
ncbi:Peroxisomal leader peptide-processing protease [Merluccius polli]|uniref:Peroxisomal leader peptide-processing protease n=1 Tax=Merluccius polli TaxID=89951 RepID=A0AA47N868_MERPO|nr:Peroxisomal leader peptide-processing protease [Merluccius polli]